MPKKALIFTYYWPPSSGPGVQRFLKFCKFLPEFDWEPIVVTPANGSYPYTDDSLLKDVSEYVKVYKTKTLEPFAIFNMLQGKKGKSVPVALIGLQDSPSIFQKLSKYIRANCFIPDARVGWKKYAIKEGSRIIQNEKIDVIITTSPPHSTHLVGLELQKKHNIPWLADFRDPWTNIYFNRKLPRTARTKAKDKALEDKVVKHADQLIERILFLEGLPSMQSLNKLNIGQNVEEILKSDLGIEHDAHKDLKAAIVYCEDVRDFVSRELFEDILSSEEEHIDFLETQISLVGKMGLQNYIQLQTPSADD